MDHFSEHPKTFIVTFVDGWAFKCWSRCEDGAVEKATRAWREDHFHHPAPKVTCIEAK